MNKNRTVVHTYMAPYGISQNTNTHARKIPKRSLKNYVWHTDLVLGFDIESSTFDEVFHHWQVSISGCHVECCIVCISEIKHVNSHHRSKVLSNANMATPSSEVKSIESTLCMYVQHKQNTIHTDIRRSEIKHNQ